MSREAVVAATLTAVQGVSGVKGAERGLKDGTELAATDLPYGYVHTPTQTTEVLRGRQRSRTLDVEVLVWFDGTPTEAEALLELVRTALETDSGILALVERSDVTEDSIVPFPETTRQAILLSAQTGRIE